MAIVWAVIAAVLVAVELRHLALYAIFGAAGAAAAAIVAVAAPGIVPLQVVTAVAVAGAGVVLVRPHMSQAYARRGPGVRIGGVHGGLVAARGITLDEVGILKPGHVRILGERWLAVAAFGGPIPAETPVIVTEVSGTTLTVRPADEQWEIS